MKALSLIVNVATILLAIHNGVLYLGTVVELLKQHVGFFAYLLWIPTAPFLSPCLFFLPWFVAWVDASEVNTLIFWLWASWLICIALRAILGRLATRK